MLESLGQLIAESLVTAFIVAGILKILPFEWERWRQGQDQKDEEREQWLEKVKNSLVDIQNWEDRLRDISFSGIPSHIGYKIDALNGYTQDYLASEYNVLRDDIQDIHDILVELDSRDIENRDKKVDDLVDKTERVVEKINDELDDVK